MSKITKTVRAAISGWQGGGFAPLPRDCRPDDRRNPTWPAEAVMAACARPRQYVARQSPKAANDNKPRLMAPKSATASTPERLPSALRKSAPALYRTLCRLRELARPAEFDQPEVRLATANDNNGVGIEHRHSIDPGNVEDLLDAYADGMRSRVVAHRNGTVDRFEGGVKYIRPGRGNGEIVEIGGRSSLGKFFGMRFHRGVLMAYARNGKRVTPSYNLDRARGSDEAAPPRVTLTSSARHLVLAEIDRADAFADFCARVPPRTAQMLKVILAADNFQEVARAANMTPTAHNGRRVTEKMLTEAEKILAA